MAHSTTAPRSSLPDGVLLDAGGVLLLPDPRPLAELFGRYGGTTDLEVIGRSHYAPRHPGAAHPGRDEWWQHHASSALTCGVPASEVAAAVEALFDVYREPGFLDHVAPGAFEGLRSLAETGLRLAIVSNHDGTMERRLHDLGICQIGAGAGVPVDAIVDSGAVGVRKPDPRIFAIALDRVGLAPHQVAHVGDHVGVDVAGARAAGVHPIHFDPYDDCSDRADHDHVRSLTELSQI